MATMTRSFLQEKRKFNYLVLAMLLFGGAFLAALYLLL
jgi:hypothetical protein